MIAYNTSRGTITRGPTAEQIEPYLGSSPRAEPQWPYYYLALAGVSGLAVGSHLVVGWGPEGLLPGLVAGMLAGSLALSLWHLWSVQQGRRTAE